MNFGELFHLLASHSWIKTRCVLCFHEKFIQIDLGTRGRLMWLRWMYLGKTFVREFQRNQMAFLGLCWIKFWKYLRLVFLLLCLDCMLALGLERMFGLFGNLIRLRILSELIMLFFVMAQGWLVLRFHFFRFQIFVIQLVVYFILFFLQI